MAKNTKRYAIVNKKNIIPLIGSDTKSSRYLIRAINDDGFEWNPDKIPVRRKASTRAEARAYKKQLSNPRNWQIIDLIDGAVVR